MTDRLFTDCCYGSPHQHTASQPCPQVTALTPPAAEGEEDLIASRLMSIGLNGPRHGGISRETGNLMCEAAALIRRLASPTPMRGLNDD